MSDNIDNSGTPADDMAEYLQTFLDETEEQLDDLVETLLALEDDLSSVNDLNEAFRLIHSIKGSAGMMGFDNITVLTHHLENRFERFRSGTDQLDEPTMNLVLRCIDFLRQCNGRLRDGEQLGSAADLLDELRRLEEKSATQAVDSAPTTADTTADGGSANTEPLPSPLEESVVDESLTQMVVHFRAGLQLPDLKAQLIASRLSRLGEVKSTTPRMEHLAEAQQISPFEIQLETQADLDSLRAAADVDGVESIEFPGTDEPTASQIDVSATEEATKEQTSVVESATDDEVVIASPSAESSDLETSGAPHVGDSSDARAIDRREELAKKPDAAVPVAPPEPLSDDRLIGTPPRAAPVSPSGAAVKVAETMRVDIDRLDNLMNLAGELVANRARFIQISRQVNPALRKTAMLNRIRDFSDGLERTIDILEGNCEDDLAPQIQRLRAGLELMDEQATIWDNGRQCFSQINEAIDQLSRVSHSLQQGVLDTRMVPVGPLFNRFKRVVRDLSKERGRKVNLQIRGENTELDKRMIDELGDPLVHLIRNSIDHGMEPPDVRVARGKPETGTICLEASHSGNNVYIHIRDDGNGIDVERIRSKLVANQVLSELESTSLSRDQALEYIWHPGFSTAKEVTDVSGRGVGMDVVKTRINLLKGTIAVDSTPHAGTVFTLRLPLTLAIISCLLVRIRNVLFSMPIDDVREIVSVERRDIVTVHGKQTFEVRGEFIPLVGIDEVFDWHDVSCTSDRQLELHEDEFAAERVEAVVLNVGGKTMGLSVNGLLGSQDIVVKSLSDNFIDIHGLSGASILGDGTVCLMLDVATVIDMATKSSRTGEVEEVAS